MRKVIHIETMPCEEQMNLGRADASAVVPASPDVVYKIIADYCHGHPGILPREYFRKVEVLEGGTGAGT